MIRNGRVKDEDAGATVVFFFGNHPDLSSAVAGPWSRIVRKKCLYAHRCGIQSCGTLSLGTQYPLKTSLFCRMTPFFSGPVPRC